MLRFPKSAGRRIVLPLAATCCGLLLTAISLLCVGWINAERWTASAEAAVAPPRPIYLPAPQREQQLPLEAASALTAEEYAPVPQVVAQPSQPAALKPPGLTTDGVGGVSMPSLGGARYGLGAAGSPTAGEAGSAEHRDHPARVLRRGQPRYPSWARNKGIEGFVVLRLFVGAEGTVSKVEVIRSQPPGVFDAAALRAARSYRFAPARKRGRRVKATLVQRMVFRLARD